MLDGIVLCSHFLGTTWTSCNYIMQRGPYVADVRAESKIL